MLLLLSHVLLLAGDWKKVEHPPEEGVEGATPTYARVRHGSGKFIHGDYEYEGEFVDDQMSGKGVFKFASGASYDGEWKDNQYSGQGTFCWADGTSYTGEWASNK